MLRTLDTEKENPMKVLVITGALLTLFACARQETSGGKTAAGPASTAASPNAEKTYTMTGKLISRDAAKSQVTIDNDEVPGGVMAKMTMDYELRGAKVETLPADQSRITSTLHELNGEYWVTDVKPQQ